MEPWRPKYQPAARRAAQQVGRWLCRQTFSCAQGEEGACCRTACSWWPSFGRRAFAQRCSRHVQAMVPAWAMCSYQGAADIHQQIDGAASGCILAVAILLETTFFRTMHVDTSQQETNCYIHRSCIWLGAQGRRHSCFNLISARMHATRIAWRAYWHSDLCLLRQASHHSSDRA